MQCSGSQSLIPLKNHSLAGQQGTKEHARYLKPGALPSNCRLWLCGNDPANAPKSSLDRFEVAFEYDPRLSQAAYLGSNLERAYELSGPCKTGGTLDVWNWWLDADGLHVRIPDLKTGWAQSQGDLPEPWDSWQLRWYALAVVTMLLAQYPGCALASLKVAWFIPIQGLGVPAIDIQEAHRDFTAADLETFRRSLCELVEQLIKQAGSVWRTGPWCGRCQALTICPQQRGVVERLGATLEGEITADTIITLRRSREAIKKLVAQAEDLELSYITQYGQLETRPGYVLGLQNRKNQSLAPDALDRARLVLSKAPVKESLDIDKVEQNDMPKLIEAGAVKVSTSTSVREMRVKGVRE